MLKYGTLIAILVVAALLAWAVWWVAHRARAKSTRSTQNEMEAVPAPDSKSSHQMPLKLESSDIAAQRQHFEKPNVSRCRFFVCGGCGRIYEKPNLRRKIDTYSGPLKVHSLGSIGCAHCGTQHLNDLVYMGSYDLPKSEWLSYEEKTGKRVILEDAEPTRRDSEPLVCHSCGSEITIEAPVSPNHPGKALAVSDPRSGAVERWYKSLGARCPSCGTVTCARCHEKHGRKCGECGSEIRFFEF